MGNVTGNEIIFLFSFHDFALPVDVKSMLQHHPRLLRLPPVFLSSRRCRELTLMSSFVMQGRLHSPRESGLSKCLSSPNDWPQQ